jgi:hypothetical protein
MRSFARFLVLVCNHRVGNIERFLLFFGMIRLHITISYCHAGAFF